jgi:hypothetical protein
MAAEPETLQQATRRLKAIAEYVCERFDAQGTLIAPVGVANDVAAMRLILDRLEREVAQLKGDGQ